MLFVYGKLYSIWMSRETDCLFLFCLFFSVLFCSALFTWAIDTHTHTHAQIHQLSMSFITSHSINWSQHTTMLKKTRWVFHLNDVDDFSTSVNRQCRAHRFWHSPYLLSSNVPNTPTVFWAAQRPCRAWYWTAINFSLGWFWTPSIALLIYRCTHFIRCDSVFVVFCKTSKIVRHLTLLHIYFLSVSKNLG